MPGKLFNSEVSCIGITSYAQRPALHLAALPSTTAWLQWYAAWQVYLTLRLEAQLLLAAEVRHLVEIIRPLARKRLGQR